jgi:hypothetical protein
MPMKATCSQSGEKTFEYFNLVQRENQKFTDNPEKYIPWNY